MSPAPTSACRSRLARWPRVHPGRVAVAVRRRLRPVTLLLGFRPDVQFAPFYLAQQAGYYADVGLDVTIEHKGDADLVRPGGRRAG